MLRARCGGQDRLGSKSQGGKSGCGGRQMQKGTRSGACGTSTRKECIREVRAKPVEVRFEMGFLLSTLWS